MGRTQLTTREIGSVQRNDFDITTAGQAVCTRLIAGTGVTFSSTGVDTGTGDVTINSSGSTQWLASGSDIYFNTGKVGMGIIPTTYQADVFTLAATGLRAAGSIDINQVPEPTAPTMALVTTAGNVDVGAHYYKVTYTTAVGETREAQSAASITTDASHKQVTVTIPVSTDTRVTGRKIYRTKAGDLDYVEYLLATIANNTATSYTDNIADASLTTGSAYFRANTTNNFITVAGAKAMMIDSNQTSFGYLAGSSITSGGLSVLVGDRAGQAMSSGVDNTIVAHSGAPQLTTGDGNTLSGSSVANELIDGTENTMYGRLSGYSCGSSVIGSVFLGSHSGRYETGNNKFFVDNQARTDEATSRTNSLLYGVFNATVASQTLRVNAILNIGANFRYTPSTESLSLSGTDTGILIKGITNEPSTPAASTLALYTKDIAGKMVLKQKGPSGLDTPLQSCLYQNCVQIWTPTNVTGGNWQGDLAATTGTWSNGTIATTNTYTSMRRSRYANVITTTSQVLGVINTNATWLRGNAAGIGGFFYAGRIGFDVWTNGSRFFAGFATATTVISADPSALANTCGFMVDAAGNGLIYFGTKDGTTSNKTTTGLTIASNKGYDCYIFAAPNGSSIGWRIVDMNTGTEASGTTSTNLPVNTTVLKAMALASNAALTPVTSTQIGINRIYLESDF